MSSEYIFGVKNPFAKFVGKEGEEKGGASNDEEEISRNDDDDDDDDDDDNDNDDTSCSASTRSRSHRPRPLSLWQHTFNATLTTASPSCPKVVLHTMAVSLW